MQQRASREMMRKTCMACLVLLLVLLFAVGAVGAQTNSGIIRGQVTDPSGAAVVGAAVLLTTPSGGSMDTTTNKEGIYEFKELPPGKYEVKVVATGFGQFDKPGVAVAPGQTARVDAALAIQVQQQTVEVTGSSTQVDVNPANNANAIVIQGKDLDALSDDPDELESQLQALAGPSAGPNGGQIYIDGFTAGQLPPKASIREIRINQNPFSAEYDKLGYGRIEILTKPGTDKFHGQLQVTGNDSAFNSTDPFAGAEPNYYTLQFEGSLGGPIKLIKNSSFFISAQRRNINDLSAIDAQALDQNLNPVQILESVPTPHQRTNIGPRFDYAITKNNTLTARYQFYRDTVTNSGLIQPATLPTQAYDSTNTEHTLQIGD